MDIRHAGDLVDHRSQALAERPAALGENEEAFRGRRAVSLPEPPPEPMEDRAPRSLGADVGECSGTGNRFGFFQPFVMTAELAQRVEAPRIATTPTLPEPAPVPPA